MHTPLATADLGGGGGAGAAASTAGGATDRMVVVSGAGLGSGIIMDWAGLG